MLDKLQALRLRPSSVRELIAAFEVAIRRSFMVNRARAMTQSAIDERFEICYKIFKDLFFDHGWSIPRICDHMPEYLRCELDGEKWEPSKRAIWMPPGNDAA